MVKSYGIQSARIVVDTSLLYVHNHNTKKRNSLPNRLSLRIRNTQAFGTTNETTASTSIALKHNVPRNVRSIQSLQADYLAESHLCSSEFTDRIQGKYAFFCCVRGVPRLLCGSLGLPRKPNGVGE